MEFAIGGYRFDSVIVAGALVSAAVVFAAYSQRYDIAYSPHGTFVVRVDRYTGKLDACVMERTQVAENRYVTLAFPCDGVIRQ